MADENCSICGRTAVFYSAYLKQNLCKKHFEHMVFRRIRAAFASSGLKAKDCSLPRGNSAPAGMIRFLFKDSKGGGIRLQTNTLEDFAVSIMEYFAFSKKPNISVNSKGTFSPLYTTSEKEIAAFLDLKGINFHEKKRKGLDAELLGILEDIEKRRPGGMLSIVKIGRTLGLI